MRGTGRFDSVTSHQWHLRHPRPLSCKRDPWNHHRWLATFHAKRLIGVAFVFLEQNRDIGDRSAAKIDLFEMHKAANAFLIEMDKDFH